MQSPVFKILKICQTYSQLELIKELRTKPIQISSTSILDNGCDAEVTRGEAVSVTHLGSSLFMQQFNADLFLFRFQVSELLLSVLLATIIDTLRSTI